MVYQHHYEVMVQRTILLEPEAVPTDLSILGCWCTKVDKRVLMPANMVRRKTVKGSRVPGMIEVRGAGEEHGVVGKKGADGTEY